MTAWRIIGLLLLAAALLFGVADWWHGFAFAEGFGAGALTLQKLWVTFSLRSFTVVADSIQRLWSPLWQGLLEPILTLPAWTLFSAIGAALLVLGRPRAERR
jgi:hypothetical protein